MTLIADVFLEILAPKNMVRYVPKKPCFRGSLDRQEGNFLSIFFVLLKSILNFKHMPKKDHPHS